MKAFLTIALLLTFGAGVWGNTPEEVTPEQIAEWKEAAENGNVDAQYNLSVMYDYGRGVPGYIARVVDGQSLPVLHLEP